MISPGGFGTADDYGDWRRPFEAELAGNRAIAGEGQILAPPLIATGELFPGADANWPYLISERLDGTACETSSCRRTGAKRSPQRSVGRPAGPSAAAAG